MGQWNEAKIGEIAEVKGGKRIPKGRKLIKEPNSHPYIRIRNLGKTKYMQLNTDYEYVDEETQQMIARYIVNQGDILISVVGTIGLVGIVGNTLDKANQTENCDKIINIKKVLSEYLYYYLVSSFGQDEIKKGTVGAVQPKLPLKNVKDIIVKYPPIKEQKQIVEILSAIDEKIELNETINNNLYEQMLAIFDNAKRTSSWHAHKLGDVLTFFDNLRKPLSSIQRAKMTHIYPYYGATSIVDYVEDYLFDGTYILISEDGANVVDASGHPLTQYTYGKFWVNNHAHIVKGKSSYSNALIYAILGTLNMQSIVTGAAQPKINQANLRNFETALPENEEAQTLSSVLNPMFKQIIHHDQENEKLSALRDTLLPQLISGELDVSDIDL